MSKKAIVVVSFGTSHEDTLEKNIVAVEQDIAKEFPDFTIKRAFTSGIIKRIWNKRGVVVHDLKEALDALKAEGYEEIYVQPTHLLFGSEYDKLFKIAHRMHHTFKNIFMSKPLVAENEDLVTLVDLLTNFYPENDRAVVLMGHGTYHRANMVYPALNFVLQEKGHKNTYIGTVEGYPELDWIIKEIKASGKKKVLLAPLMLVAGDHVKNDMIDNEDSWKNQLTEAGFEVETLSKGLGEYEEIRKMYVEKLHALIK